MPPIMSSRSAASACFRCSAASSVAGDSGEADPETTGGGGKLRRTRILLDWTRDRADHAHVGGQDFPGQARSALRRRDRMAAVLLFVRGLAWLAQRFEVAQAAAGAV